MYNYIYDDILKKDALPKNQPRKIAQGDTNMCNEQGDCGCMDEEWCECECTCGEEFCVCECFCLFNEDEEPPLEDL